MPDEPGVIAQHPLYGRILDERGADDIAPRYEPTPLAGARAGEVGSWMRHVLPESDAARLMAFWRIPYVTFDVPSAWRAAADSNARFLNNLVMALATDYMERVERGLRQLGPGESLCMHEARSPHPSDFDVIGGKVYQLTWRQDGHVLPKGFTCEAIGVRTVYGPAPDTCQEAWHLNPHRGCILR